MTPLTPLTVLLLKMRTPNNPFDVQIGTIHAAKGLETPYVLVFPAYTHRQIDRFHNGAEKRRLYYIAMTRASEALFVVHDYFGGEKFPSLEENDAPIPEVGWC